MSKPDEYKKIIDSYATGYETYSNKELIHRLNTNSGTTPQDIIKAELTRRLIDSIDEFNQSSSVQTNKMLSLTKWIIGLTIIIGILTLIQVINLLS